MESVGKRSAVTLKDIGRIVGVTPMVVSDVLNGRTDRVRASAETRERILNTAFELNYRPNSSARAMRGNQFHNIGYLTVRDPLDYTIEAVQSGICERAHQSNYQTIMIKHFSDWNPAESDIPSIYREARLDALIIDRFRHSLPKIAEQLLRTGGFPIVSYNEKRRYNAVYVDDVFGSKMVTSHLIGQGFTRISHFRLGLERVGKEHYSVHDRVRGYRDAMDGARLKEHVQVVPEPNHEVRIMEWLERDRPQAVVCYSDNDAFVLQRAMYRLRWRAPDDLAIAGFNGENLADNSPVPLTTVCVPFFEMGKAAADMAIQLAEKPTEIPSVKFQPTLRIQESSRNIS